MYDYQAMCKVPYHHHSGARPLLSVRICHPAALPGLGFLLQGISSIPQKTSGDVCSQDGTVQAHLRQIPEAVVATDVGFQCGILLPYRSSLKIGRSRERMGARLWQVLL